MSAGLVIRPYAVQVAGFGRYVYHTASRGKALAAAWRDFGAYSANTSFKDFLRLATASKAEDPSGRFGEPITVSGLPAFFVDCNRQYIRFVRPDSEIILNSHPYDVEPPEARRGTPYYEVAAP